jgi:hypothetical protein
MPPPLSEQQKHIEALTRELDRLGAFVISVPGSARLRFQILTPQIESVLLKIRDLGYQPAFCNVGLRFVPPGIAAPCTTYEINLPVEQPPVHDDRTIRGEIAVKKELSAEERGMRKALGLD